MSTSTIAAGDLVKTSAGVVCVVINTWEFHDTGLLVAVMLHGDVKVFPCHEITKVEHDV